MRVIRAAEYRRMAWKNGGGETMEVAISPRGAGLDEFDWRVSMARVESDGPFSLFPGIERTLLILEGSGIRLALDAGAPVDLTAASEPLTFPGDVPASSRLIDGPVLDFNVMTRRGTATQDVTRHRIDAAIDLAVTADVALLFCQQGQVQVETAEGRAWLGALDSVLVVNPLRNPWHIAPNGVSRMTGVEIRTVSPV